MPGRPIRDEPADQVLADEAAVFHAAPGGVQEHGFGVGPGEEGGVPPAPRGRSPRARADEQAQGALGGLYEPPKERKGTHRQISAWMGEKST
jgi:hypothetical protein